MVYMPAVCIPCGFGQHKFSDNTNRLPAFRNHSPVNISIRYFSFKDFAFYHRPVYLRKTFKIYTFPVTALH